MTNATFRQTSEKQTFAYMKGKLLLQAILLVLGIVVFLFTDYLAFYHRKVDTIGLMGGTVLGSIFQKGIVQFISGKKTWELILPVCTIVVSILCVIVPILVFAYSSVQTFQKKKDNKLSGYVLMIFAALLLVFYIVLLTSGKVMATNAVRTDKYTEVETFAFFEVYEIKPTFLIYALIMLLTGAVQIFLRLEFIEKVKRFAIFYVLLSVPTLLILIFNVYPSILQTILAFKDYRLADGVWGSAWNQWTNFVTIFSDDTMLMVIWQTIYLSILRLVAGIIPPVFFALVFYHITSKGCKNVIQTIVYIPHFFSWVVIYAIFANFFMPNGVINNVLVNVFHQEKIDFLSKKELFYPNMIFTSIWKEVGWGTILFTASLMSIDSTLFEAASLDGAGVFAKLRHITLPALVPILVYQIIMAIGNILKGAGGEQILLVATSAVRENKALVIDTWLYWEGLKGFKYGLSAAISFVQAVIGFFMVIGAHKTSQRLVGIGAW